MADAPRYVFHPLERRGVLLGLEVGQLLTIAGAAGLALVADRAIGHRLGVGAGGAVLIAGIISAVWTRDGRPVAARALAAGAWLLRRIPGPDIDDAPWEGIRTAADVVSPHRRQPAAATTAPPGIELLEDAGLAGDGGYLGVIRDRRQGTWAGVVPVGGCSFSLLDPAEQAQRLEGWRRVLGAMARPGSPVVRVQWVQRTWTGGEAGSVPAPDPIPTPAGVGADAGASYQRLLEDSLAGMCHHATWLVLAVRPPATRDPRSRSTAGIEDLRRELRLADGQLRAAGLDPHDPLDTGRLADLLIHPHDPGAGGGAVRPARLSGPWPMATDDGWSAYRADGAWHVTYWISEWPRVEVGPDFLAPVLVGSARCAVSLLMAPVPAERALRQVRSARTADLADAQLRSRAGFLESARRSRESEGVSRREAELVDGHHEFRFSGYVTVTANDLDQLRASCAETEHAAQSARIEIKRLYGRQAEAFTWTLPLGRGLR